MPKKRSEKQKKEKLKYPPIEIDFDELLYLNSWPVKTAIYGLFRKGDVVETPDGIGTVKSIRENVWKVCNLFVNKWNADNRTAFRDLIYIANREMNRKEACLFLQSSIFPFMESKGYQPNEKMVDLVDKVLSQTEATPTEESEPTQPVPKPQKKSKRHEENNKQKKAAREVAKQLWEEDETRTIAEVIISDPINNVAPNRAESTLRKWIKDLAPSNAPGRRPKNK